MSNLFGAARVPDELRAVPHGVTVGSYQSYVDAQKAVDYLADQQFPVQFVSIVGNDLKSVERVTGKLSYPRVALSGLLTGVWFGLFIGLLLSLFSPGGPFSIITSVLMGAAFFMLFGIVSYAMQRGRRDFTSTNQVIASSYDVVVAPEAADGAVRLLRQLPMRGNDGGAAAGHPGAAGHGPGYGQHGHYGQGGPGGQGGQAGHPGNGGHGGHPGNGGHPYGQGHEGQYGQRSQDVNDSQQSTAGAGPDRPQEWDNPYGTQGQQPGTQQPGTQNQGTPVQGDPAVDGAGQADKPHPVPGSADFRDLPDGRPQFGVRLPHKHEGEQPASNPEQVSETEHSAAAQAAPGAEAGATAEPGTSADHPVRRDEQSEGSEHTEQSSQEESGPRNS